MRFRHLYCAPEMIFRLGNLRLSHQRSASDSMEFRGELTLPGSLAPVESVIDDRQHLTKTSEQPQPLGEFPKKPWN